MLQLSHPYMTTGKTIALTRQTFVGKVMSLPFFFLLLYNIVLVLPYINMHLPQVYMCSPSWTPLPPPSPYHPSGSSQCTSPKIPVSCIEPGLAIHFLYDIIHVLMPFSQICLCFLICCLGFPPGSKRLLISWLQSPSAVILEPKKIKSVTISFVSPSICHEVMELDAMILGFWMLSFKPAFSFSSFTFINRLFSSSLLSAIRVVSAAYRGYWYFSQESWFQLVLHPTRHFPCTLHIH